MKNFDLGIVGGCASGLVAAINAKRKLEDYNIIIFEKMPRVGKKLLSTGNGRCNMTNVNALSHNYTNADFTKSAFASYPPEKVIEFFNNLGVLTYTDECGRVYPRSNNATSVLDALRFEVESLGITVLTEYEVNSVKNDNGKFIINNYYCCSKLIIAAGGKSSSAQGSDGSGYKLAKSFGHSITKLYPSLVSLNTAPDSVKSFKGIRAVNVGLKLENGYEEDSSYGEILFKDNGISGIAAMELASGAEKFLVSRTTPILHVDFLPEYDKSSLCSYLDKIVENKKGQPMDNLLSGIIPKAIGIAILKASGIYYGGAVVEQFSENMISAVADLIKDMSFEIKGTKGFNDSQVTCGGIKVSEIDSTTMKSKLVSNLYFCGEIIDVDGRCGGFNLQWAFASGLLAGELK